MNSTLDVMAGLGVGAFLLIVAVKGNSSQLVTLAEQDKGFLKWAIAVGILYYLRGIPELHESITLLIAAAFVGLFLLSGPQIAQQAESFWNSLSSSTSSSTTGA